MLRTAISGSFTLRCPGAIVSGSRVSIRYPARHHKLTWRSTSSDSRPRSPDSNNDPQRDATRFPGTTRASAPYGDHFTNMKEQLRGWSERISALLRQHIDKYTASLAVTFSQLGREINKVTGYGEIEVLKQRVARQEGRIEAFRRAAREAKEAYDKAVLQRASSQREVNDLLQRKSSWTDEDVVRFTSLVRQDHLHEQEEARAKTAAAQAEDAVEREFSELMRVILNRYHEEQAWSDKIRSASTYGSLAVMGVNMLVFVLAIVLVEPWKRRKLAQTFEKKVEDLSAESATLLESKAEELVGRLDEQDKLLSQIMETVYYSSIVTDTDQSVLSQLDAVEPPTEQASMLSALKSNRDLAFIVATSATAAGIIGWLARSWYGS